MFIPFLFVIACSSSSDDIPVNPDNGDEKEIVELKLVDSNSTNETKAFYANLWNTQSKGVMFGHHDDLIYGRNWYNKSGRSDIKDVCGDYPAVFSVDFAEIMDDRSETSTLNEARRRCILEARKRGEVITACCHLNNPLTGGDSWDNSNNQVVTQILEDGSSVSSKYKGWLDKLAHFVNNLKDENGALIPIIFRPYHEHTQSWSWWGKSCTTADEFITFWQFTINYLRDVKGVHNLVYAISPQMDGMQSQSDILFRWPGDDYVDFIGMDCYHGTYTDAFKNNLKNLEALSKEKMKPCGVTETGVEGIRKDDGSDYTDYWTKEMLSPIIGREVSMIVLWRNKYDPQGQGYHFYAPFKGQASTKNFVKFYQSYITLFSDDLPDMYAPVEGIEVE